MLDWLPDDGEMEPKDFALGALEATDLGLIRWKHIGNRSYEATAANLRFKLEDNVFECFHKEILQVRIELFKDFNDTLHAAIIRSNQ
jgi:hypothetical protein